MLPIEVASPVSIFLNYFCYRVSEFLIIIDNGHPCCFVKNSFHRLVLLYRYAAFAFCLAVTIRWLMREALAANIPKNIQHFSVYSLRAFTLANR
jgi:hypothetical protein